MGFWFESNRFKLGVGFRLRRPSLILVLPIFPASWRQVVTPGSLVKSPMNAAANDTSSVSRVPLHDPSSPLASIVEEARRISQTPATVLLTGETGTGKEVFARFVHEASARKGRFVSLNCGAIPESLIESELFGHAKGAFTGAQGARKGRVSLAKGGTLFLDEIGELKMEMQVKLLRLLQERTYEPVGSDDTQHADFRLIAATNRDLAVEVSEARFRADLYYRLLVCPLHLPPLRERPMDVPVLFQFCWSNLGESRTLGSDLLDALKEHDWPGNVRELENLVERLSVCSLGDKLTLKDLPESYRRPTGSEFAVPLHNPLPGGAGIRPVGHTHPPPVVEAPPAAFRAPPTAVPGPAAPLPPAHAPDFPVPASAAGAGAMHPPPAASMPSSGFALPARGAEREALFAPMDGQFYGEWGGVTEAQVSATPPNPVEAPPMPADTNGFSAPVATMPEALTDQGFVDSALDDPRGLSAMEKTLLWDSPEPAFDDDGIHITFPVDLPAKLRELEDRYIDAALLESGGNKQAAADLLGLRRTTLVEKLRRRQTRKQK